MRVCDNCRESDVTIVEFRTQKLVKDIVDITQSVDERWVNIINGHEFCEGCLEDLSKLDWSRLAQRQPAV
jgi:hypothetical protein